MQNTRTLSRHWKCDRDILASDIFYPLSVINDTADEHDGVIFQGLQLYVSKSLRLAVQLMLKVESVTATAPIPIETLFTNARGPLH